MARAAGDGATGTAATRATSDGEPSDGDTSERAPVRGRGRLRRIVRVDRVLLVVIVAGTVLRFWGLGAQSMWYDEWLSAEAAIGDLDNLRRYVTEQAGIPPTYFAVLWGWVRIVGDGDAAMRALSASFGVATIPVAYALARALDRPRFVARTAALLVAVHPMLIWYSQEARPYSLLALLGALSLLTLARFWSGGRRIDLVLWALVCASAIAVHYFAVFLVAAEVLAVLVLRRPRRRDLLAATGAAGMVLGPLAPFAVMQFSRRGNHSWITDHPLSRRLREAGQGALVGPTPLDGRAWMIAAAVVALAVVLVVAYGSPGERRAALAAGGLGVATVVLALAANVVGVDVVLERYLIVTLVLLVVAVAVGLGATRVPRGIGWAGVAVLCVLSLTTVVPAKSDPDLQRADWRAVADAHQSGGTDGPRLLVLNLHDYLGLPLHRYLDAERALGPDEEVTVEHIDLVVAEPSDRPCNGFVGLVCTMALLGWPPPEPLWGQLTLDERIELDQFTVERYHTDGPVTVGLDELVIPETRDRSLVLVTGDQG